MTGGQELPPRASARRKPSTSQEPAGPSASQNPPSTSFKPPPPSATTALEAVQELRATIESYSLSQLNKARRTELSPFLIHLESLIVLEGAAPRPVSGLMPESESIGSAAPPLTDILVPLQASVSSIIRQAVESIGRDIRQTIKSSLDDAIKTLPRSTPPDHRQPPPPPAPAPRPAPRDGPKHLEVVIGIPRADQPESFTKQTPAQLKTQVEQALSKSQVVGLTGTAIQGVRRLSNGSILVRAMSAQQADLLLRHDKEWASHLVAGARVERKTFRVTARAVPTEFDPAAPRAREALCTENGSSFAGPGSILGMHWLHEGRGKSTAKRAASLVITVADAATADTLIYHSLSVCGALCPVSKYLPPPLQCFHCQAFGHLAKACPHAAAPSALRCARCAGPHALRDCTCPAKTKCSDGRRCPHIKVRCANCQGSHKSFDNRCPAKAFDQAKVAARFDNGSPYFNPSFCPPSRASRMGSSA